jgi:hypothetical protein
VTDFELAILEHPPAVHELCAGAFVQERLRLADGLWAIPLKPLGFRVESEVTARYVVEVLRAPLELSAFEALLGQGASARPMVAVVFQSAVEAAPEQLEPSAAPHLERARLLVSWSAGERAEPIALVTAHLDRCFFRTTAPLSRGRRRLGFGNEREPHEEQLRRLFTAIESDERFAFAIPMFRDALCEENAPFRVARFFACLEALTYRIRHRYGSKSRAAVRALLGLDTGASVSIAVGDRQVTFDHVEIGGRLRDKLFHGVPFDPSDLTEDAQLAFKHLEAHPDQLRDPLQDDCALEIARWANGASLGQA